MHITLYPYHICEVFLLYYANVHTIKLVILICMLLGVLKIRKFEFVLLGTTAGVVVRKFPRDMFVITVDGWKMGL